VDSRSRASRALIAALEPFLQSPARRANGYRAYTLRDAVQLARIRRLTELGLNLDEVKDALGDDAGKDLYEVLAELDLDLARQEEAIRLRRVRLAELLRRGGRPGVSRRRARLARAGGAVP
jgi:DNA-binding transcriptional MerR regulator